MYGFFFRIMYGFLIIHVITLLEFEQALKNFLDLKIYRVFIKQFDQIKGKAKKIQKREREIKRMGKNHKCKVKQVRVLQRIYIYIFNKGAKMIFFFINNIQYTILSQKFYNKI